MNGEDFSRIANILLSAGVPFRIGLMIATALFLGYFSYEQTKTKANLIKAIIFVIVFLGFEVWITATIFNNINHPVYSAPTIVIAVLGIVFLFGYGVGAYLAKRLYVLKKASREHTEKIIEEIKTNGNGNSK